VFKLGKTGKETVLHTFNSRGGRDRLSPKGLIQDAAGSLYGSTLGTADLCGTRGGCGTIFKMDVHHTLTTLFRFTIGRPGEFPLLGLFRDAAGRLYGATAAGGSSNNGTVFEFTP